MTTKEPKHSCQGGDEEDSEPIVTINHLGHYNILPDHKIDESFMSRHQLEAGLKLTCSIDGEVKYSNIYASSTLDTFDKLKLAVSECSRTFSGIPRNTQSLHIDKFVLEYTNIANERVSSEVKPGTKTYRKTGTEYSPETFNAMMKATTAQVSILRDYCVCNDTVNCEMARRCPVIHVSLSRLNEHHEKIKPANSRRGKNVHPDKVVITDLHCFQSHYEGDFNSNQSNKTPKLMVSQACLQRLVKTAQSTNMLESLIADDCYYGSRAQPKHKSNTCYESIDDKSSQSLQLSHPTDDDPSYNVLQSRTLKDGGILEISSDGDDDDDDAPISGVARYRRAKRGYDCL